MPFHISTAFKIYDLKEKKCKSSGPLTAVIADPGDGLANVKEKVLVLA